MAAVKDRVVDWWRRRRWTKARYSRLAYFSGRSGVPALPPRRTLVVVVDPAIGALHIPVPRPDEKMAAGMAVWHASLPL